MFIVNIYVFKRKIDVICKYNIYIWDNRRCVKNIDL